MSSRRRLLRAGAGLAAAATAGCLDAVPNPLGGESESESGMRVRARAASGTETDTRCRLSPEFVAGYPALEEVLAAAEGRSDEWATTRVTVETGESLGDALQRHCEGETRGLYGYRGEWYFVSLRYEDPDDHDHGHGSGHTRHEGGDWNETGSGESGDTHHHDRGSETAGGR